jgi:hypothetical protein
MRTSSEEARGVDRIAYIVSSGRSGSTLIDLLLGSHSQCFSLGEIEHLPKNLTLDTPCSCGCTARSCGFWNQVAQLLLDRTGIDIRVSPYAFPVGLYLASRVIDHNFQTPAYLKKRRAILLIKHIEYMLGTDPRWLSWLTKPFEDGVANTLTLYDAVSSVSGRTVLVDSSKEYRKAIALYRKHPERVRLIVLSRDGRGVFSSKLRSGFSRNDSVRPWAKFYERALPLLERNVATEHRLRLRYEDLAQHPEDTLQGLCRFLAIDFEPGMLAFRETTHHILNGNDMRMSGPSEIRLDERWRSDLPADDLAFFERLAGRQNRALGYDK